ncbi:Bug family tripartite tricarboxylate transporter substrate binding protein [Usitatibacter palustris]|uniref:Tripartite-type tricarboxylate transporter, receptor component TctC n=1 Tax=Usitatibacter palustris TaxID=2732487 RepID=A0A6M4H3B8_9PROT|nr:tripartite tricarboxylate transporter substrate binding protein [Usitatibacter palustris]QJR13920.1 hypothetical protein DSM104440_00712 [Usitatibacter palustris]
MMIRRLAALACALFAFAAAAQYPNKPIRFVVPFAPGGSSEIIARSVAQQLTTQLGQSVYVENKAGGAGTIAMGEVAKSPPDGYTIILTHVGTLAVNPYAMTKHPYDVDKDFIHVALLARVPNLFVVGEKVPAKDFKEFLALAKKEPGKLNYGSAGNGSAGHLAFEYLKMVTDTDIVHVAYKGTGPQLQDLLGGRLDAASAGMPALISHIKSGKLRPIVVGTAQRVPALPDVPTMQELGYKDFETSQWYGVSVPAGTPKEIVDKLSTEINKALRASAVTERFAADNASVSIGTPAEYQAFIKSQQQRWKAVVEKSGLKID